MTDHILEDMLDDLAESFTHGLITENEATLLGKAIETYTVTGHLPMMQAQEVAGLHHKYHRSPEHG